VITKLVTGTVTASAHDDEVISFLRCSFPPAPRPLALMGGMFFALLADRGEPLSACAPTARSLPWQSEERSAGRRPSCSSRPGDAPIEIAGRHIRREVRLRRDRLRNRDETHYPRPGPLSTWTVAPTTTAFASGALLLGYHLAKWKARTALGAVLADCRGCGWTRTRSRRGSPGSRPVAQTWGAVLDRSGRPRELN